MRTLAVVLVLFLSAQTLAQEFLTECRYTNAGHTMVRCLVNGTPWDFPANSGNRFWQAIVSQGVQVAAYE